MKRTYKICFKKLCVLTTILCIVPLLAMADETFVKPRQAPRVSSSCLKETCVNLMADILEVTQNCSQQLLSMCAHPLVSLEKNITKIVRSWITDDATSLTLSKSALCNKRDRLIVLKKRCQGICDDITRLGGELKQIKAELQSLEASC